MATLKKVTVEFDKNNENGKVCIQFLTELLECHDRLALTAKFKEEVEPTLVKDGYSWSSLFKVTDVPIYNSWHKWLEFELELLRVHKPTEWSEEHYKDQITCQVLHLCRLVKHYVDPIEERLLENKFPEVRWNSSQF